MAWKLLLTVGNPPTPFFFLFLPYIYSGSILGGVIAIFYWHNPSGRTMALRSNHPLTEMKTTNISSGVKAAGACGWQPYHLHVPIDLKSESLNLLESSVSLQACTGIVSPLCLLRRNEEIPKLVILYCLLLRYIRSFQHPLVKHLQSVFLPYGEYPSLTVI